MIIVSTPEPLTLVVEKETRVGVFQRDVPDLRAGCGRQWAGPVHDAERQVRADHHQVHTERDGDADRARGQAGGQVILQTQDWPPSGHALPGS